jgi:alpha-galactosidase
MKTMNHSIAQSVFGQGLHAQTSPWENSPTGSQRARRRWLYGIPCLGLVAIILGCGPGALAETVWLSDLDLSKMRQGYGKPQINRSMREKPLSLAGQTFERGVGTHANSTLWIDLGGGSDRFQAAVGLDDAAGSEKGSIVFRVQGDGRLLWESGVMKQGQSPAAIDINVKNIKILLLQARDAGDGVEYDHADWAEARFQVSGSKPATLLAPPEEAILLTPKPGPVPRINGPRIHGCRPGHPFLFRIPTTGARPIQFSARSLPATLQLDPETGIITGTAPPRGEYRVVLRARNSQGNTTQRFKIISGDTLALTPPMGWNHWYTHYDRVTDTLMRQAADVMVRSGMADVGYQFVSIDDCWMNAQKQSDPLRVGPARDAQGNLLPNRHFPDMKSMTAYIHAYGLKAGIYTSPGPRTCADFTGSYQHEELDARQFAEWGFDFLKYDWCSYGEIAKGNLSVADYQKPYRLMGNLLQQQSRDIVFNLCQYGMGNVWEWGAEVGGHCWRTAGDLGFELDRIFEVALHNVEHRAWSKPGSWNDPDYIQIGFIGNARGMGIPQPCPITPSEQYAFLSMWALMAAPLFYSGDMNQLDEFTLNVLCNPEVIDVDQDPLGRCARVVQQTTGAFLMIKELEDGSLAVGLCNPGELATTVHAPWESIGCKGRQKVRDLWRQQDCGVFIDEFSALVPRHGVALFRVKRAR